MTLLLLLVKPYFVHNLGQGLHIRLFTEVALAVPIWDNICISYISMGPPGRLFVLVLSATLHLSALISPAARARSRLKSSTKKGSLSEQAHREVVTT